MERDLDARRQKGQVAFIHEGTTIFLFSPPDAIFAPLYLFTLIPLGSLFLCSFCSLIVLSYCSLSLLSTNDGLCLPAPSYWLPLLVPDVPAGSVLCHRFLTHSLLAIVSEQADMLVVKSLQSKRRKTRDTSILKQRWCYG